ncbi:MAG: indolepyruvate ferredoxin oxidoreductase subunit alpha [Chloroflexota bacterium]|nr:indolepyruvate ferredoxin oxidoreductase subunit alpha [Chloroflexota bacterium]
MKRLLSGNEAVALGAFLAGTRVASAYPGTPSTEILETLAKYQGPVVEWAANEKVALDVAAGAAYAGRRALACMKHVGLNVAADSLFYVSYTGLGGGGLVIVTADDPGMHSSQNEQDNRNYGKFARVPVLEPSDSQEAADMVQLAYEISERFDTPVLFRTTTRIAHSLSPVEVPDTLPVQGVLPAALFPHNPEKFVTIPAHARKRHPIIEARLLELAAYAETAPINRITWADRSVGIITGGIAYQYAREVLPNASYLKLGMSYPPPTRMIRDFAAGVDRVLIVEDLDPFWEEAVRLLGIPCEGKAYFPLTGELSPEVVRLGAIQAGLAVKPVQVPQPHSAGVALPPRPPVLCPGCPHRGVFFVLRKLKLVVDSDIGCYTLGVAPPLSAVDTCGCMGASIGVAHGVSRAETTERAVAVVGDSTFFHSGLSALASTVYNRGTAPLLILDNRTTAMTGHQGNPGTGLSARGEMGTVIPIEGVVRGLGVQKVWTVDPYNLRETELAVRAALAVDEPSVVICRRECVLLPGQKRPPLEVDEARCDGCGLCLKVGCPAIVREGGEKVRIEPLLCTGCTICQQTCFRGAIQQPADNTTEGGK